MTLSPAASRTLAKNLEEIFERTAHGEDVELADLAEASPEPEKRGEMENSAQPLAPQKSSLETAVTKPEPPILQERPSTEHVAPATATVKQEVPSTPAALAPVPETRPARSPSQAPRPVQHVERLEAECRELRQRNVMLEATAGSPPPAAGSAPHVVSGLTREDLESELARQWGVTDKLASDVVFLTQELAKQKDTTPSRSRAKAADAAVQAGPEPVPPAAVRPVAEIAEVLLSGGVPSSEDMPSVLALAREATAERAQLRQANEALKLEVLTMTEKATAVATPAAAPVVIVQAPKQVQDMSTSTSSLPVPAATSAGGRSRKCPCPCCASCIVS